MNSAALPPPESLVIRVHGTLAEVEADWRRAEQALAGFAFQTFEWVQSFQETFGAVMGVRPCIVTVAEPAPQGRVVMLLPLGIVRRRALRELVFLGKNVSDYNAPLLDAALAESLSDAAFAALWRRILAALPAHDLVRLWLMPARLDGIDGAAVDNPMARLPGATLAEVSESATLAETYPEFVKRLKSSFMADTRRHFRRMGDHGPVVLEVVTEPAARRQLVDTLIALKSRRWVETKVPDWSQVPGFRAFYETMSTRRPGDGEIHASQMRVGETVVAVHWGIVWRRRFYYLMLGWEGGAWRVHSPGRMIVDLLMQRIIPEGVRVFDFTVGNEGYKKSWVDTELPLYALTAPASVRGRLGLAAEGAVDELRERAKRLTWLRRAVRRAMGRAELKEGAAENPAGKRR